MPPNKGSSMKQRTLNFKSVKQATKIKQPVKQGKKSSSVIKKPRGKVAQHAKLAKCDMHVKLHIPVSICKNLPSVKTNLNPNMKKGTKVLSSNPEQRGMGVYKRHIVMPLPKEELDDKQAKLLLGAKKRRGEIIKYQLHLQKEEKFKGMVFDIAFGLSEDIVVTCTEEAVLCDRNLIRRRTLEKIMSPGGAAFLNNGEILVVCRCSDNVNVFTANGTYIRSFPCGPSPCGITVNSSDEIIVTDTGAKLVKFFSPEGKLLRSIEPVGSGYELRWPLYLATNAMDDVIVSDCHQQKVLVFDENGLFKTHFQLRTQGGNQVLRPHGLCLNKEGDLFIIDTAIDSMEVFQWDGTFRQTLLPSDDGVLIKPKISSISPNGACLAIGGMRGAVRLYKFVSIKEESAAVDLLDDSPVSHNKKVSDPVKREIKREIKKEVKDDVIVLD